AGDVAEAQREFQQELSSGPRQLYAAEFAMNTHDGAGFAFLRAGEPTAAAGEFRRALELFPEHARSLLGLGAALNASQETSGADAAFARAMAATEALRRGGRASEANLVEAMHHAVRG